MTAARRLARFRVALVAFVPATVLLIFVAIPALWRPSADPAATITAIGILLGWWPSFAAVCFAEAHLHCSDQQAGAR